MKAPAFWQAGRGGAAALALTPFGWLYGLGTAIRVGLGRSHDFDIPVICVGNLIAGGSGKTPVVNDIARRLKARGINVHILTRGYGGTVFGPHPVSDGDTAAEVGDEALLHANAAPTWVADDRKRGCRWALREGAEAIILDDGFQDPSIHKDLSLVVTDGGFGFGNGRMIPAGPLRETVNAGLGRADAVVVIGEDTCGVTARAEGRAPVLTANAVLDLSTGDLSNRRLVAFAGIGRPAKFFDSLRDAGLTLAATRVFPDHHPFTPVEIAALRDEALALDADLVTTEKDFVRLTDDLRAGITAVPMSLTWSDEDELNRLLARAVPALRGGEDE